MIRVEHIAYQAGSFQFQNLSFSVPTGSYAVLMGKTGTGKTTLLELICGLRSIRKGQIWIGSQDITEAAPGQRGLGYVPQDGALFPTLTVRENLGFALAIRKSSTADIAARTREIAAALGIEHLLDRLPDSLSGGERQRVALGRALAAKPAVLLLDEPLSALDEETRAEMITLLRTLHCQTRLTVLHVTHQRSEAEQLADRLLRLENHQVRETPLHGTPGTHS